MEETDGLKIEGDGSKLRFKDLNLDVQEDLKLIYIGDSFCVIKPKSSWDLHSTFKKLDIRNKMRKNLSASI